MARRITDDAEILKYISEGLTNKQIAEKIGSGGQMVKNRITRLLKTFKAPKKSNAGRKPVADPKIQLPVYIEQSIIKKVGREKAQQIAYDAVKRASNKST